MRHWQFLFPRSQRTQTPVPTTLTVSPATFTVALGATQQLAPTVTDQFGNIMSQVSVSWSSSAPSIATTTTNGLVTGQAAGSATITATSGSASGTSAATVTAAPVATTITVSPNPASVTTGHTVSLVATVTDQFGNGMPNEPVNWASTNTAVATVSATGLVTGVAAGSCTISAIDVAHPSVIGNSALTVTASVSLAFNPSSYPHSSTGLLYAYTDFRTGNIPDPGRTTERTQIPTMADKVIGVFAGAPAALIQQPYTLTMFVETCVSDAAAVWDAPLIRTEKDYLAYCTAHGLDPEDGYLHYASGQPTFAEPITAIDTTGKVTLAYDTQTYASTFQNGDSVTIAAAAPQHNGTWTISNVSVTGGSTDVNGDKVNAQTTFTIPVTGATSPTGTVKRTGDGTQTKRNRFQFFVGSFPPPRWCVNPKSTVRQAYERDRLTRVLAGTYTPVAPDGCYVDEVAENRLDIPATATTVEYADVPNTFYTDVGAFFGVLRADHPSLPWVQEIGSANYTGAHTIAMLDTGAKASQYEGIINSRVAFNWSVGGGLRAFVMSRIAAGVAGEIVTAYGPIDSPVGGGGNYTTDPAPVGFPSSSTMRVLASGLAITLGLYDPINHPGTSALNLWNDGWSSNSLANFWPKLCEVALGLPTADATTVVTSTTLDPLGQPVQIDSRAFAGGLVLYRGVQHYDGIPTGYLTNYSDLAAYTYTLPASTGVGGQWQRVRADGSLELPTATVDLRPDEGVILLPAVAQPIVGPDASFNPTSGVVINVGDTWQTTINAHAAGTTYWIKAGTHANQSITPKSGDVYWAEAGAIMTGTGTTSKAISGTASNVTIRNLEVTAYTSPFSSGAIQGDWNSSTGWLVEQCNLHGMTLGAGLYVTDSITVRYNLIHHNGQIGLLGKANNTAGSALIYGNEISFNNTNNNDINNEAGGLKILQSTNVQFHDNYVHDNTGVGIWFDGSNVTPTIEHNRTINNTASGIMSELSYGGTIRYNTITGNALGQSIAHAAVLIAESSNTAVYGNSLSGNNTGIVGIAATRGSGPLGPWVLTGLDVHDNSVHIPTGQASTTGIIDQIGDGVVFGSAANNHFNRNRYYTTGLSTPFSGNGGALTFAQWQAQGYDMNGENYT